MIKYEFAHIVNDEERERQYLVRLTHIRAAIAGYADPSEGHQLRALVGQVSTVVQIETIVEVPQQKTVRQMFFTMVFPTISRLKLLLHLFTVQECRIAYDLLQDSLQPSLLPKERAKRTRHIAETILKRYEVAYPTN